MRFRSLIYYTLLYVSIKPTVGSPTHTHREVRRSSESRDAYLLDGSQLSQSSNAIDSFGIESGLNSSSGALPDGFRNLKSYVPGDNIVFRSATRNITSTSGYTLYTVPINQTTLRRFTTDVLNDLAANYRSQDKAGHYACRGSSWSLDINLPEHTITYETIYKIVHRLASFVPPGPDEIVWTRVGVLIDAQDASKKLIGDVILLPSEDWPPALPNALKTTPNLDPRGETLVITALPNHTFTARSVWDDRSLKQLVSYAYQFPEGLRKRQASDDVLAEINHVYELSAADSPYKLSLQVWKGTTGTLRKGAAFCYHQATKLALDSLVNSIDHTRGAVSASTQTANNITSGAYILGDSVTSFTMQTTLEGDGERLQLPAAVWSKLANMILKPLIKLKPFTELLAVGGDILGPLPGGHGNGTIGFWQMVATSVEELDSHLPL